MKVVQIKLLEVLEREGKTQAQLADAIEVRRATINDMYHNRSKQVPLKVLAKICTELNCDISDLLTLVDEKETKENAN